MLGDLSVLPSLAGALWSHGAALVPHMLHLVGQTFETLLKLLAGVAPIHKIQKKGQRINANLREGGKTLSVLVHFFLFSEEKKLRTYTL